MHRSKLLNTAPIAYERSPQVLNSNNETRIQLEKAAYEALNSRLAARWTDFWNDHPNSLSILVDTAPIFNEALDDPAKIGMKNATCEGDLLSGCVWADDFHPGPALHGWIAKHVADKASSSFPDFFA